MIATKVATQVHKILRKMHVDHFALNENAKRHVDGEIKEEVWYETDWEDFDFKIPLGEDYYKSLEEYDSPVMRKQARIEHRESFNLGGRRKGGKGLGTYRNRRTRLSNKKYWAWLAVEMYREGKGVDVFSIIMTNPNY
jgi:hypothetical protein